MPGQLGKLRDFAAKAGKDPDRLLAARLAPDMFALSSQIAFACGLAREFFARLGGEPIETLAEPRHLEEALQLIDETLAWLDGRAADPAGRSADRIVEIALPDGMIFDLRPDQYVRDWALPQFYFHALMAYAILRREGVPLGKADYVPHMMRYLRVRQPGAEERR
jgi:hypothetical protein